MREHMRAAADSFLKHQVQASLKFLDDNGNTMADNYFDPSCPYSFLFHSCLNGQQLSDTVTSEYPAVEFGIYTGEVPVFGTPGLTELVSTREVAVDINPTKIEVSFHWPGGQTLLLAPLRIDLAFDALSLPSGVYLFKHWPGGQCKDPAGQPCHFEAVTAAPAVPIQPCDH
jgi:hypothetical protein